MKPWYSQGLRFKCTGCGRCCTGAPGYVWVSEEEILNIALALNMSVEEVAKKYIRKVGSRFSLKERSPNYDCVFLEGAQCKIYQARPKQCRTFPWWPENVETPAHWKEAGQRCEGINHPDAPLVSCDEIQKGLT